MAANTKRFEVPPALAGTTLVDRDGYAKMYEASVKDPEKFWSEQAMRFVSWASPWHKVVEYDFAKAQFKWFVGATLNVSVNCIDRHLAARGDQRAIVWEGNEPGDTRTLTYRELHRDVCRFANVLRERAVKKGDRVAIYMPMVPEAAIAMLACARIGAVHSVIFGGFSADSVRDRVLDSTCSVVVTANEGLRGTKTIPLKAIVDEALASVSCVHTVIVFRRTNAPVPMQKSRDIWLHEAVATVADDCAPVMLDSEDPLFILYTSGSTGKPKGVLHTQGGYLLYAAMTHRYVFDYRDGDVYFCAADVGWVTGHTYIVYGPLANGAITMMFESTPIYPDAGRYWDVVERHKVNIFYTAPTAIRAIAKEGNSFVERYDTSSLRILGSVGEPINEDAWLWYFEQVGKRRCAVVDTWWQTETGGIMITPLPGATPTKPGSATLPFFGVQPCIVDDEGKELTGNGVNGRLCIKYPWPGQSRTIYGDHDRFVSTYFSQFPGKYFTGDAAIRDDDGYYWLTGRVDDVLNVAGHRLGTAEIESAIVSSGIVAEAAVVGMPHPVKGLGIYAYCILRPDAEAGKSAEGRINEAVKKAIGGIATPDAIQFVPGLPKTRSGKIMRRILRKIAEGNYEEFGDITTLAEPSVVESIVAGAKERASRLG